MRNYQETEINVKFSGSPIIYSDRYQYPTNIYFEQSTALLPYWLLLWNLLLTTFEIRLYQKRGFLLFYKFKWQWFGFLSANGQTNTRQYKLKSHLHWAVTTITFYCCLNCLKWLKPLLFSSILTNFVGGPRQLGQNISTVPPSPRASTTASGYCFLKWMNPIQIIQNSFYHRVIPNSIK